MTQPSDVIDVILAIVILVLFAPVVLRIATQLGGDAAEFVQSLYTVSLVALFIVFLIVLVSVIEGIVK